MKTLLKKATQPYDGLLAYRTPALECGYSPAQLSMGRQLRSSLPVMASVLEPLWDNSRSLQRRETINQRNTEAYDRHHGVRPLSMLHVSDPVWVQDANTGGTVVSHAGPPRSYLVQTPTSCLRRNRRHLWCLHRTCKLCRQLSTARLQQHSGARLRRHSHARLRQHSGARRAAMTTQPRVATTAQPCTATGLHTWCSQTQRGLSLRRHRRLHL